MWVSFIKYRKDVSNLFRVFCNSFASVDTKWNYSNEHLARVVTTELVLKKDIISEAEEADLMAELDSVLSRQRYQSEHWDYAITNFRELEKKSWRPVNKPVIDRLKKLTVQSLVTPPPTGTTVEQLVLPLVHVLDLGETGEIKPHVDSVRFCGDCVTVLSLLDHSILRLAVASPSEIVGVPSDRDDLQTMDLPPVGSWVDLLIPRRSVYVMRGVSRYLCTHAILSNDEVVKSHETTKNDMYNLHRKRRVSVICRTKTHGTLLPFHSELKPEQYKLFS